MVPPPRGQVERLTGKDGDGEGVGGGREDTDFGIGVDGGWWGRGEMGVGYGGPADGRSCGWWRGGEDQRGRG